MSSHFHTEIEVRVAKTAVLDRLGRIYPGQLSVDELSTMTGLSIQDLEPLITELVDAQMAWHYGDYVSATHRGSVASARLWFSGLALRIGVFYLIGLPLFWWVGLLGPYLIIGFTLTFITTYAWVSHYWLPFRQTTKSGVQ